MSLLLSIQEMSDLLSLSKLQVRRLTIYLNLPFYKPSHNQRIYKFPKSHPFYQSYLLLKGPAKPIYTLQEIADLYQWRHSYSTKWVTTKLNEYDIDIYNVGKKGFVYLKDLIKIGEGQNTNNRPSKER